MAFLSKLIFSSLDRYYSLVQPLCSPKAFALLRLLPFRIHILCLLLHLYLIAFKFAPLPSRLHHICTATSLSSLYPTYLFNIFVITFILLFSCYVHSIAFIRLPSCLHRHTFTFTLLPLCLLHDLFIHFTAAHLLH